MATTNLSAPVAPPPIGVEADFSGTTSVQVQLSVVFGVTFAISSLLVVMRLYTAIVLTKRLDWDSLFIVLSWGSTLAFFVFVVTVFPSGFGRHYWNVTQGQLVKYMDLLTPLAITYIWPPTLVKLSLLVLYYRIDDAMGFPYCIHLMTFAVIAPTVVYTVLFAGPCAAVGGDLQCLNKLAVAQAVTNIVTDALLIAMPIPMISRLNMPMRQKISLGFLLAFGSFVIVFSIIRSAFIRSFISDPDITHTQARVGIWGVLEVNFGLICNCLAMIKPFLRRHFPWLAGKLMGSYGSSHKYDRNYQNSQGQKGSKGFRTFGSSSANHNYELHSIDRTGTPNQGEGMSTTGDHPKIRVREEFSVKYSERSHGTVAGDNSSTDEILNEPRRYNV